MLVKGATGDYLIVYSLLSSPKFSTSKCSMHVIKHLKISLLASWPSWSKKFYMTLIHEWMSRNTIQKNVYRLWNRTAMIIRLSPDIGNLDMFGQWIWIVPIVEQNENFVAAIVHFSGVALPLFFSPFCYSFYGVRLPHRFFYLRKECFH